MSSKHRRLLPGRRSLNAEPRLLCHLLRLPTCLLPSVTGTMGIQRSRPGRVQGAIPRMAVIPCLAGQGTEASQRMAASPATAVTLLTGAILNPATVVVPGVLTHTPALALRAPVRRLLQLKSSARLADPAIDHVLLRPTRRLLLKIPWSTVRRTRCPDFSWWCRTVARVRTATSAESGLRFVPWRRRRKC